MTVYLGADHRGHALAREIESFVKTLSDVSVVSFLSATLDPNDDYPLRAQEVGEALQNDPSARGILLCGSGVGVCVAANKMRGIRAALASDVWTAEVARQDDDINILCLAADRCDKELAYSIVETFLSTPFSGEDRHVRRKQQIEEMEC